MARNIKVEKTDLPELEPWLTVQFYKTKGNRIGFDFKLESDELSERQKEIIIDSENLVCKWLKISKDEFNKVLARKLEEIYPQLKNIHSN